MENNMNPIYTLWNGSTIDLSRIVFVDSKAYDKKFNGLKSRCVCLITIDCRVSPIEIIQDTEIHSETHDFLNGVEALILNWKKFKENGN
jgi:hypothetical protein